MTLPRFGIAHRTRQLRDVLASALASRRIYLAHSFSGCQPQPMGKQVQFYMTHEDEKNFLASISDLAPVRLVYHTFTESSHMELESFVPVGGHEHDVDLC